MPASENCQICQEEAPFNDSHRVHYGGMCCFSCKAFFRRANQGKIKDYKCKAEGKCPILHKSKNICKKCRLDRCVEVGMDPKLVLSAEEKRARFKKFFKKKEELASKTEALTRKRKLHELEKEPNKAEKFRNILPRPTFSSSAATTMSSQSVVMSTNTPNNPTITLSLDQLKQLMGLSTQNPEAMFSNSSSSLPTSPSTTTQYLQNQLSGLTSHTPMIFGSQSTSAGADSLVAVEQNGFGALNIVGTMSNKEQNSQKRQNLMNSNVRIDPPQIPSEVLIVGGVPYIRHDQIDNLRSAKSQSNSTQGSKSNFQAFLQGNTTEKQQTKSSEDFNQGISGSDQNATSTVEKDPQKDFRHINKDEQTEQSKSPSDCNEMDTTSDLLSLRSQISCILDAFTFSCGKLYQVSETVQDLILSHQKLKPLSAVSLISQLSLIASMLTDFATTQLLFMSLSREDQVVLLKSNIPLYLQYISARYFTAETGLEQLNWILEGQIAIDSIEQVTELQHISLKQYNKDLGFFPSIELAELYSHLSENTELFYPFPQHCNGLVANMLLYHTNEIISKELKEPNRVSCIFQASKDLVKMGHKFMDRSVNIITGDTVRPLLHTLSRMRDIFGTCQIAADENISVTKVPKVLQLNFTDAEKNWIWQKFAEFEAQLRSVHPTEEYLEDALNLLLNKKAVSKNYMPNWLAMTEERGRRVLKNHPEFQNLMDSEQEALWGKNKKLAVTLAGIRLNSLKTGKSQFKNALGFVDSNSKDWESEYKDVYNYDDMQSFYIHDQELNHGKFDEESMKTFCKYLKEMSDICSNDQMYHLITVLTLVDTEGMPYSPAMREMMRLRQNYLKFYQRKLTAAECSFADYAGFKSTLKKVKILSDFMGRLVC